MCSRTHIASTPAPSTTIQPMPSCTLHYQLTYPEFREAMKAAAKVRRRSAYQKSFYHPSPVKLAISFLICGLLISIPLSILLFGSEWIPNSLRQSPDPSASSPILVAFLIGIPLYCLGLAHYRRLWKSKPHLSLPHTLTATETHLTESCGTTNVQIAWQDAKSWLETPLTILITSNLGHFIIPKHSIPQPDLETLRSLLTTKSKALQPTSAFPIETHSPKA